MKRVLLVLCLMLFAAACAPAVPATVPVGGNTVSQNPTTAPTEASVESNAAVPAANNEAVSGEAQTPTQICQNATPAQTPSNRTFAAYPEMQLQPDVDYRAVMCTGAGAVYVDLFEDLTPITVNSFVFLAQQGYYNNTTFHRVIQDFMAQGGDPTGTGTGGPGYTFQEEFVGFLHYDRPGWLAMARTNQPGSNGSQFFITTAAYSSLDYQYTLFGEVLEGLDNVRNIRLRDPQSDPNPGTSLDTVVIVTDPASVVTTYTAPAPGTSEQVVSGLQSLSSDQTIIQASLQLSVSGALSASEVQASAPAEIRDGFATFMSDHNFAYRVTAILNNPTCNMDNAGFMTMSYTVDAYDSREDAAAAFADPFWGTVPAALGVPAAAESTELGQTLYSGSAQACNQTATRGLAVYNYGRYIITVDATVPANSQAAPDVWIGRFANIFFGRGLSDVLRAELR